MTKPLALLSITIAVIVADARPAISVSRTRLCRRSCGAAVAACVNAGEPPRRCTRRTIRDCVKNLTTCGLTTVTTTTRPRFPTTTTTLPAMAIGFDRDSVQTLFELGFSVSGPGFEFVSVDTTITNDGGSAVSPYGLQLATGGLGYPLFYPYTPYGGPTSCNMPPTIPPGSAFTCTAVFRIPEGATRGRLELQNYVGGPAGGPVSAEFDIPTRPHPFAGVDVTIGRALPNCVPRPDFKLFEVGLTLSSHQGASEMTLGGQAFSVVAGGARYRPTYCVTSGDDCSDRIGIPVDGSASCSLVFEVPVGIASGTLEFSDGRYQADADFVLP